MKKWLLVLSLLVSPLVAMEDGDSSNFDEEVLANLSNVFDAFELRMKEVRNKVQKRASEAVFNYDSARTMVKSGTRDAMIEAYVRHQEEWKRAAKDYGNAPEGRYDVLFQKMAEEGGRLISVVIQKSFNSMQEELKSSEIQRDCLQMIYVRLEQLVNPEYCTLATVAMKEAFRIGAEMLSSRVHRADTSESVGTSSGSNFPGLRLRRTVMVKDID